MRLPELHALLPGAQRIGRTGFRAPCPAHGGKSQTLSVSEGSDGRLLLKCFAECTTADVLDALGLELRDLFDTVAPPAARTPRQAPQRAPEPSQEDRRKALAAAELWAAAQYLTGGPGVDYLLGRTCRVPPRDGDLRWHPDAQCFGFAGPALVGRITKAEDARVPLGLHLTWLERDGSGWRRAERRYLGAKAGGVVRLWPDEAVTLSLGVAEGVETALSLAHLRSPVWACLDAGNLAALPVLEGIESLTIAADRDESGTGQRAAALCARRWLNAGREVLALLPDALGSDLNDEVSHAIG